MIQELLGGGFGVGSMSGSAGQDEQKKVNVVMSNIGAGLATINDQASSNSLSSSSSDQHPNLRCPRCDSSNTKFCYYNNYNLTQPRHFCKTCRRYWTKGGALRNVPIGGGCRKSKAPVMSAVAGKSTSGKARPPIFTSDVSKVNMVSGVIDHHHQQIAPHNSQLMALLRAADQTPSYNSDHILNSVVVKDQVAGMLESNLFSDHASLATGVMCSRTSPLMGLCNSIWRSNSEHDQQQQLILPQLSLQQNFLLGQVSNINGFQDLHIQRFRSSPSINYDHASSTQSSSMIINNPASDSSLTSSTNEAAAMAVGELSDWNNTLQWTDLSTSNGSIP